MKILSFKSIFIILIFILLIINFYFLFGSAITKRYSTLKNKQKEIETFLKDNIDFNNTVLSLKEKFLISFKVTEGQLDNNFRNNTDNTLSYNNSCLYFFEEESFTVFDSQNKTCNIDNFNLSTYCCNSNNIIETKANCINLINFKCCSSVLQCIKNCFTSTNLFKDCINTCSSSKFNILSKNSYFPFCFNNYSENEYLKPELAPK